jgi:hypothetical protein
MRPIQENDEVKKSLISAIAACAALAMPALALADAMGHDAMTANAMSTHGTMICRQATEKEKPSAMMTGATQTPIVCKKIQPDMMMKGKGGPDLSKALTAEQVDAAWRQWIVQMTSVPGNGGG